MIEFINFYIIRVLANRNANLNKFITIRYKSIYFLKSAYRHILLVYNLFSKLQYLLRG